MAMVRRVLRRRAEKVHGTAPPVETPHLFMTARLTVNKDHVDLSQGETPETTTTIGLKLVEQFRKTIDKQYVFPLFMSFATTRTIPLAS